MKYLISFFVIFFSVFNVTFADYNLEKWSSDFVKKYSISMKNLDKNLTRKEFVEILYKWYWDYMIDKWIIIDYWNYKNIDNKKVFIDVDLNSDFWKKLCFFASNWAFSKKDKFNPNDLVDRKTFFIVMKNLWILNWIDDCKKLKICEKEVDNDTVFVKWTFLKYSSKILDKKLRVYYSKPSDYLKAWYLPYLKPKYSFPIAKQTLNWCYAFSAKNIIKYKNWENIDVAKTEKIIWKKWSELWSDELKNKFNENVSIRSNKYFNIDTLISSLQVWEPVAITYTLKYYSAKEKKDKFVSHIVAAYSFDEKWFWVAETVSWKRSLVSWNEIFDNSWKVKVNRMFNYYNE